MWHNLRSYVMGISSVSQVNRPLGRFVTGDSVVVTVSHTMVILKNLKNRPTPHNLNSCCNHPFRSTCLTLKNKFHEATNQCLFKKNPFICGYFEPISFEFM